MTTLADAKRLAVPLLARNRDLAMVKRLILIKPVTHILRGFELAPSLNSTLFLPTWFTLFTFDAQHYGHYSWGERFLGLWERDDPTLADRVVEKMEGEILPLLRPIHTIAEFAAFANSEHLPDNLRLSLRHNNTFLVNVALGQLDEARAACGLLRGWAIAESRRDRRPQMGIIRLALELVPLVEADDREGMARLLWGWEAAMIKALKLEKYWVKEPFPLEEQNALAIWKEM